LTEPGGVAFRPNEAITDVGPLPEPGRYPTRLTTLDGELIYDVVYTIGEDGLRVTPEQRRESSVRSRKIPARINVFGGSFVFGQGLEDDQTLPFYLARELGLDAKNFGFMGWGPQQALVILESGRDTRGAANVLLTAPWHAPRATCSPEWSGGMVRFRLASDGSLVRDGFCPDTPWFADRLTRLRLVVVVQRVHAVVTRGSTTRRQLELYHAIIERIGALSRERGQTFVIGYIGADALNGVPLDNAAIMQRLATSGATVVDVSLATSEAELSPEFYLHELDRHPSARANAARAQLLAPAIAELLEPEVERPLPNDKALSPQSD
jgi:hypothetical protein